MSYAPPFTITTDILNLVADISQQVGTLQAQGNAPTPSFCAQRSEDAESIRPCDYAQGDTLQAQGDTLQVQDNAPTPSFCAQRSEDAESIREAT